MKGYNTASGYMGQMPDGTWMLFASEADYRDMWEEVRTDGRTD